MEESISDKDEMREIIDEFIVEANELAEKAIQDVVAIENNPDEELDQQHLQGGSHDKGHVQLSRLQHALHPFAQAGRRPGPGEERQPETPEGRDERLPGVTRPDQGAPRRDKGNGLGEERYRSRDREPGGTEEPRQAEARKNPRPGQRYRSGRPSRRPEQAGGRERRKDSANCSSKTKS